MEAIGQRGAQRQITNRMGDFNWRVERRVLVLSATRDISLNLVATTTYEFLNSKAANELTTKISFRGDIQPKFLPKDTGQ